VTLLRLLGNDSLHVCRVHHVCLGVSVNDRAVSIAYARA